MNQPKLLSIVLVATTFFASPAASLANGPSDAEVQRAFLQSLEGKWEGQCRTWFTPEKLADESQISGEFNWTLGKRFLRHTYTSSMKGKPRKGEETIVFNPARARFQTTWIDDFHMSYGILMSEGKPSKNGFTVTGEYAVGPGKPRWRWKTVFLLEDKNHLTITAYNISPAGKEGKAVETKYVRKSE